MPKLRTVAIIQARMGSSRLPGKVLLDLGGQPMLGRVVSRVGRAKTVDQVVVATTIDPSDDPVAAFCRQRGIAFWRGSLHDVLDRYYTAASHYQASLIVRITADCPLIDPQVIDRTVLALFGREDEPISGAAGGESYPGEPRFDFAANRLPPPWGRTYPIGLDTEVCTYAALERAWKEASQPYQREHVMPYLYVGALSSGASELLTPGLQGGSELGEGTPVFRIKIINHQPDLGHMRWTVDTPDDLALVRQIYARFEDRDDFSWQEVLALLEREPELSRLNAGIAHKSIGDVDQRFH